MKKLLTVLMVAALAFGFAAPASAQTYGAAYVTAITYMNLSGSNANITFSFYSEASGTAINEIRTLAAYAAGSLNVGSLGSISAGFKGSSVLSSDQPVAATLVQLPPAAIASKTRPLSNGFSAGSPTVLIATAIKATFSTTSIISVQNTDSVDNNFSVSFYAAGNPVAVLVDTTAMNIPSGAAKYYDLGTVAGLATTFNGSAVVVATKSSGGSPGSAVATIMELSTNTGGKNASSFEGSASGGTTVYMPSAQCLFTSAQTSSNYALQNTSSTTTAYVTTTFSSGVVTSTQIAAFGKASVGACAAGNVPGYNGAATIESTQPIIAIGKISGGGLSTAFVGISTGASKVALPYVRWANPTNFNNGTKQRTNITIQNVGGSTILSGTVTVKYYDATGLLVITHVIATDLAPGAKANSNANATHPTDTTFEFGFTPSGGSAIVEGPGGSQLAVVARVSSVITLSPSDTPAEDYNGIPVGP